MKKLLCIVLIIGTLAAVCSCGKVKVDDFIKAIENTDSSSVTVETVTNTALGTLTSRLEVNYKDDGSATINYSYEEFNSFEESSDDVKKVTSGTVYRYADGTYSEDLGIDFSQVSSNVAINLEPLKKIAKVNEAGDVLIASVPAETTEAVFGTLYTSDVYFEINIQGGTVKSIEMEYGNVSVVYQYS